MKKKLSRVIPDFKGKNIAVVGDIMVDHFIWGNVKRISPEAPVPVVAVSRESVVPGGAANVVNNIHALGGNAFLLGVIGDDLYSEKLLHEFLSMGLNVDGIIKDTSRPTIIKTRIVAHNQQVVRFDREEGGPIKTSQVKKLCSFLNEIIDHVDGIIISDYGKGVVLRSLVRSLLKMSNEHNTAILVDPNIGHFSYYKNTTIITPNICEASMEVGKKIKDIGDVSKVGKSLIKRLSLKAVLITMGESGMTLITSEGEVEHIPTVAKEVYDVTGAGDTVISALALSITAGLSFNEAATMANHAAGVVVGKLGTSTCSGRELLNSLGSELK